MAARAASSGVSDISSVLRDKPTDSGLMTNKAMRWAANTYVGASRKCAKNHYITLDTLVIHKHLLEVARMD